MDAVREAFDRESLRFEEDVRAIAWQIVDAVLTSEIVRIAGPDAPVPDFRRRLRKTKLTKARINEMESSIVRVLYDTSIEEIVKTEDKRFLDAVPVIQDRRSRYTDLVNSHQGYWSRDNGKTRYASEGFDGIDGLVKLIEIDNTKKVHRFLKVKFSTLLSRWKHFNHGDKRSK